MAEERIGITIVKDDPCDMCDPETCEGGCLEKYIWERGMTRTEAIDKMAKAMCADDVIREGYYEMANVALKAILGE